jgi:hypothetical protein
VDVVRDFVEVEEGADLLLASTWVDLPEVLDVLSLVALPDLVLPDLVELPVVLDMGAFFLLVPPLTDWDGRKDLPTPGSG